MSTVLVVDDSPTDVHTIRAALEKNGYHVQVAKNGEDGLAQAKELQPDLILMDVVMPGINGFQATRQLHRASETTAIPIIIVSSKDQDADKVWGMRQGASDYLVKPVRESDLLQKVRSVLGK